MASRSGITDARTCLKSGCWLAETVAALTPSASIQWEVVGTSTRELTVRALGTIDGTLILDIKSYIPVLNRRDDVRVSEWVDLLGGRTSQDRNDRD